MRRDLSATLYLLANYFGVISSVLQSDARGTAGDANVPGTPAHQLFKIGRKIHGKVTMLIPSMSQHSEWQRWEPTIGGKYPREAYDEIILRSTRIMAYLTLVSYTLKHPTRPRSRGKDKADGEADDSRRPRSRGNPVSLASRASSVSSTTRNFRSALAEVLTVLKPTHHTVVSTLTLLSNSLLSGQRLPPFLPLPRPFDMTRLGGQSTFAGTEERDEGPGDGGPIRMVDSLTGRDDCYYGERAGASPRDRSRHPAIAKILDPRNMEQPGYAEFAVLQVCTTLVCDDLEGLMKAVSGLVGVVDFSFRFVVGSDSTLDVGSGHDGGNGGGSSRSKGKVE